MKAFAPNEIRELSQEELQTAFRYDSELGVLYWKKRGKYDREDHLAGFINFHGYRLIKWLNQQYGAHRLIWIYHFGTIPTGYVVKHINGVRSDNRLENLRLATRSETTERNADTGWQNF